MSDAGTGWNPPPGWGPPPSGFQPTTGPYGTPDDPAAGFGDYQGPPPGAPWGGPPPQPPRRPRRGLLIGAAAAVVLLAGGGVAAYIGLSSHPASTTSAASSTSVSAAVPTTGLSVSTVRVVPSSVLPTDQQVQEATLLSMTRHGEVDTRVYPDAPTDPPTCTLLDNTEGATIAGQALSMAGVLYADNPGADYQYSAYVTVAVFDTADAAAATLPKVRDAVKACTVPYIIPSNNKPGKPPAKPWTVGDVKTEGNQISWINTQQTTGTPWKCGKAFRVEANLMVVATLCHQNPANSASKLIDAVITNVNNTK